MATTTLTPATCVSNFAITTSDPLCIVCLLLEEKKEEKKKEDIFSLKLCAYFALSKQIKRVSFYFLNLF